MTCSVSYGEQFIAPAVNAFARQNPELRIELDLDNRLRDLVGDGYDLAVRFGHLTDSRLMARRLASRQLILCAGPDYLEKRSPRGLSEIASHDGLIGSAGRGVSPRRAAGWPYAPAAVGATTPGAAVLDMTLQGLGLCRHAGLLCGRGPGVGSPRRCWMMLDRPTKASGPSIRTRRPPRCAP